MAGKHGHPSFAVRLSIAMIPVLSLLVFLWLSVVRHGFPPHLSLMGATVIAGVLATIGKVRWVHLRSSMVGAVSGTLAAIYILMLIGILIGVWVRSGIVPAMIYYGLEAVSPRWFLPTVAITSSIVSLATGSSWSTAGTVGIAFMGMGQAMGIPAGMTAGAVISGAYFGDKMSPLSDTTNLAPAVAGTDLFTHIRHMIWTTGPSLTLAIILYTVLGIYVGGRAGVPDPGLGASLASSFSLSWWLLAVPVAVMVLVIFRVPAIPSLVAGIVLGALTGWISQDVTLWELLSAAKSGYHASTGSKILDTLLSRGGLDGMMDTVGLIISAVTFGGMMEGAGYLDDITEGILRMAKGRGSLVLSTVLTAIGLNVVAGDQYMAIVIPGRMYRKAYRDMGLHPKNLSRALEDSGTLTSSLVPWNSGGAFMSHTLGIPVVAYLPFAFLNLINPIISIIYGFFGFTMDPVDPDDDTPRSTSKDG